MTYRDWLIKRARIIWRRGEELPVDLYIEMSNAGLDVDALQQMVAQD
jgi:hypothetical protein